MGFSEVRKVRDLDKSVMTAATVGVLYGISTVMVNNTTVEMTVEQVAGLVGVSDRTARRALIALCDLGLLEKRSNGRALELTLRLS